MTLPLIGDSIKIQCLERGNQLMIPIFQCMKLFPGSKFDVGENEPGEYIIGRCNLNADGLPQWLWTLNDNEDMSGPFNFANVSLPGCGKSKNFLGKLPDV